MEPLTNLDLIGADTLYTCFVTLLYLVAALRQQRYATLKSRQQFQQFIAMNVINLYLGCETVGCRLWKLQAKDFFSYKR